MLVFLSNEIARYNQRGTSLLLIPIGVAWNLFSRCGSSHFGVRMRMIALPLPYWRAVVKVLNCMRMRTPTMGEQILRYRKEIRSPVVGVLISVCV